MPSRLLVCLAFATLCFLNTWVQLKNGDAAYFARYNPLPTIVVPVLCLEAILTIVLVGAWEFCRAKGLTGAIRLHQIFLAACCMPVGVALIALSQFLPFTIVPATRKPLMSLALIGLVVVTALGPIAASWWMRRFLLCSWPVLLIVFANAALAGSRLFSGNAYAERPLATPIASSPLRVRVVWIIFDELSQAVAFASRPNGLQLQNFDRLKAESFYATSAEAPGPSTMVSMPSLITGEFVSEGHPNGPADLQLKLLSQPAAVSWSGLPNVFDDARHLGYNTALVGWYHPYGRLLNRSLTQCFWTASGFVFGMEQRLRPQPLAALMMDRVRLQVGVFARHLPGADSGRYEREEKVVRFLYQLDRAREIVSDPSIGLALLHLQTPHPPAIYSSATGTMSAQPGNSYLDSVVLADHVLGSLRGAMEQAGLWDRSALLVSADHGWRTSYWRAAEGWTDDDESASHGDTMRVPFLLKLPGQTARTTYEQPFNTIVTRRIITGILAGKLTARDVALLPTSLPN